MIVQTAIFQHGAIVALVRTILDQSGLQYPHQCIFRFFLKELSVRVHPPSTDFYLFLFSPFSKIDDDHLIAIMRSATEFVSGLTCVCWLLSLSSPFGQCYNFRQEHRVTNRRVGYVSFSNFFFIFYVFSLNRFDPIL